MLPDFRTPPDGSAPRPKDREPPMIKPEVPPTEQKKPWPFWLTTMLMVIGVVVLAVTIGLVMQEAGPGRIFTGSLFILSVLYLFFISTRGKQLDRPKSDQSDRRS